MPPWTLVTPASRGIGLAIARRVLQTTNAPVVATARKDVDQTKESILGGIDVDESRLHILNVDFLDESTISSAAEQCASLFPTKEHHLHFSFILPGLLFPEKSPSQVDASKALLTFQTNTLGPLLFMKHFSSFLPKKRTALSSHFEADGAFKGLSRHAVWATMSARVGSISDNNLGGWYSYRASKAGVNQITKTFDNHLKTSASDNAMAIGFHPGTVKTGLSQEFWGNVRKDKLFEAEWVAERLVGLMTGHELKAREGLDQGEVKQVGLEGRGRCWDWAGKEIPP